MPYPKKLLNDNETVALDLHPHWWFFAKSGASMLVSILVGVASMIWLDGDVQKVVNWIAIAGIVISAVLLVSRYIQWFTTNFVITSDRLIYRHGVLSKHGIEIPLERVNTVFFSQTIIERMLGSGDLVIESAGEQGRQSFANVRKPSAVQNEIYKQMEANENRKFDRIGTPRGGDSIPSQIAELDELRQRGVISQAEFDQKKQQLLDKM